MGIVEKLMTLAFWLRHPDRKPPVNEHVDARLDAVEQRLRVITRERARRARQLVRDSR